MFAVDARTPGPPLTTDQPLTLLSDVGIVEVGTSATWAAHAADVMVDEALAYVADRTTGGEFLPADRSGHRLHPAARVPGRAFSRLQLAADAGCDFVGATAAVGSTSSRVLSDPRPQVGDGAALDLRRLAAPVLLLRRREPCGC